MFALFSKKIAPGPRVHEMVALEADDAIAKEDCVDKVLGARYRLHMMGEPGADDHPLMEDGSDIPQEEANNDVIQSNAGRWSYFRSGDFVEALCCAAFSVAISTSLYLGTSPRERPIPFQELENSGDIVFNLSLSEELEDETISDGLLIVLAVVIPLVIQMLLTKLLYVKGDAHATFCVYLLAVGLDVFLLEFIKNYVGYLRPNFYALCETDENLDECTSGSEESRKSFPSGHASLSFCGMTLLSLYLLRRFGVSAFVRVEEGSGVVVFQHKKPPRYKRAVSLLCVTPLLLALFISASRVVDNYHFPADVVGGAVIGFGIAKFTHGLWYVL